MIFDRFPIHQAEGTILAHSLGAGAQRRRKGTILTSLDIEALQTLGYTHLPAARLDASDLSEDDAADLVAGALKSDHLYVSKASTGRANIYASVDGMFVAQASTVDRLNEIDPGLTFCCLANRKPVKRGDLVGTVKIIPLAIDRGIIDAAVAPLRDAPAIGLNRFIPHDVHLISTILPSLKPSVLRKTRDILAERLIGFDSRLDGESCVAHDAASVAVAIQNAIGMTGNRPKLIVVFGACAVSDRHDVIPAAIEMAGGTVVRVGMPVDPGNLIVVGSLGRTTIIGAPGCARSPRENGFDWILARVHAGETPSSLDMARLGVGGLIVNHGQATG